MKKVIVTLVFCTALFGAEGVTEIELAASCGRVERLERLLGAGHDVNVANTNGQTLLHKAAAGDRWDGELGVMEVLKAAGANLDAIDTDGNTALHYAARSGMKFTTWWLLKNGADPSLKNKAGKTAAELCRELAAAPEIEMTEWGEICRSGLIKMRKETARVFDAYRL